MVAVKPAPKKRRHPDEISNQTAKKSTIPIVQLMPPPQKVNNLINQKTTHYEN